MLIAHVTCGHCVTVEAEHVLFVQVSVHVPGVSCADHSIMPPPRRPCAPHPLVSLLPHLATSMSCHTCPVRPAGPRAGQARGPGAAVAVPRQRGAAAGRLQVQDGARVPGGSCPPFPSVFTSITLCGPRVPCVSRPPPVNVMMALFIRRVRYERFPVLDGTRACSALAFMWNILGGSGLA